MEVLGFPRTSWEVLGPPGTSWDFLGHPGTSWDFLGHSLVADEAYVRESILEPNAKKHASFLKSEFAMPSFAGVLTDAQIDSLVLYIKSLK